MNDDVLPDSISWTFESWIRVVGTSDGNNSTIFRLEDQQDTTQSVVDVFVMADCNCIGVAL